MNNCKRYENYKNYDGYEWTVKGSIDGYDISYQVEQRYSIDLLVQVDLWQIDWISG